MIHYDLVRWIIVAWRDGGFYQSNVLANMYATSRVTRGWTDRAAFYYKHARLVTQTPSVRAKAARFHAFLATERH